MNILLTNDDSIHAEGLNTLANEVAIEANKVGVRIDKVFVVAPEEDQSVCSHSLTLNKPLRMREVAERRYAVTGTPADCISLGLSTVITEPIDLVVSGINHGANLGTDIANSGTVSGAMQAAQMGIPAIAVSLATVFRDTVDHNFSPAVKAVCHIFELVTAKGLPLNTLINVNVPNFVRGEEPKELSFRATTMGIRHYTRNFEQRLDPYRKPYYWNNSKEVEHEQPESSDVVATREGHVSVTPIQIDYTHREFLEEMRTWPL